MLRTAPAASAQKPRLRLRVQTFHSWGKIAPPEDASAGTPFPSYHFSPFPPPPSPACSQATCIVTSTPRTLLPCLATYSYADTWSMYIITRADTHSLTHSHTLTYPHMHTYGHNLQHIPITTLQFPCRRISSDKNRRLCTTPAAAEAAAEAEPTPAAALHTHCDRCR